MFSKALSSFSSPITSNYTLSAQPSSTAGPWKIFDARHKKTSKACSVFVFDQKSLVPQGGSLGRTNASSLKRAHEEVVERLRKEASSLARLRHPSILELQEPVEETRNGGLMFATEAVTASLASLLREKDGQERGNGGSRYVVEEADGTRKRRELEIDELEIQKGLLQLGKGLEFLHESAGLVHGNLTPEAIMINAKGDWKISGLAFCGPYEGSTTATSMTAISLSEVLNHDPRLPRTVQLDLDYTSPDFVLDNSLTSAADMFSLGLLILALYNSPHTSPLSTGGSPSSYKRIFASSSSVPTQSNNFLVPSSHPLPPKLSSELLPRLITRRPAQRLSAREFQEASFFSNILVSTLRFLDALPAKTAQEKSAFLKGLPKIIPQFPKSVLEKKVLPALLEELKDRELLAPVLSNVFAMIKVMPTGKRAFETLVCPKLREVFLTQRSAERDLGKEAGLMVVLENMSVAAENCSGKEFRDDLLPIILLALESPTHGLVDAALGTLEHVLPVLDFTTIKGELFPGIAGVFARTSSLAIKIRGLDAFYTLCGGTTGPSERDDDLNGIGVADHKPSSASAILDKFTVQEKIVPLLKGIKTKEPGVMMAALRVFKQVGQVCDTDFLAMDVLPVLWSMSLGPLLNLQQFQAFMSLIKGMGGRIEREQTRKLGEMGGGGASNGVGVGAGKGKNVGLAVGNGLGDEMGEEADFETLVSGRKAAATATNGDGDLMNDFGAPRPAVRMQQQSYTPAANETPTFSWQTSTPAPMAQPIRPLQRQVPQQQPQQSMNGLRAPLSPGIGRTVTPDQSLSGFAPLMPASQFSQPLQPSRAGSTNSVSMATSAIPLRPATNGIPGTNGVAGAGGSSIDWSAAPKPAGGAWSQQSAQQQQTMRSSANGTFGLPPPPTSPNAIGVMRPPPGQQQKPAGGGLDSLSRLASAWM
ncbi:Protein kinase domain-containing protein ppk32 [Elasticomyces elasticus]|nr:Protein kinase domain-containing protein ppk32 [Elasticomyces elasticus]KAK5764180.1 Protein kinase domain-containing protein ppk32 [Elasticomyces elasticus]